MMKTGILFFVGLIFSNWMLAQTTVNGSLVHDGINRSYILYVPTSYDPAKPAPLVLNFHGLGSNANEQLVYGDFRSIADTAGFLLAVPNGTSFGGQQFWNVSFAFGSDTTIDDVSFTRALIDTIAARYAIDQDRVYATGMSNGGYLSFLLACQLSDRIAAVASVTGQMTPINFDACNPSHPTPILQIHGTQDATVPYEGSFWTKSIDEILSYWATYNQCDPTPTVQAVPDISPQDSSTVEHVIYANGRRGTTVEHYKIIGGAHTWPGSVIAFEGTNYDIDASEKIWQFFARHDLQTLQTIPTSDDPFALNQLLVYPNPVRDRLHIQLETSEPQPYLLLNAMGQQVAQGIIQQQMDVLDMSHVPNGLYVLRVGNAKVNILKSP